MDFAFTEEQQTAAEAARGCSPGSPRTRCPHPELSLGPAAAHEETLGDLLAAHPLG